MPPITPVPQAACDSADEGDLTSRGPSHRDCRDLVMGYGHNCLNSYYEFATSCRPSHISEPGEEVKV